MMSEARANSNIRGADSLMNAEQGLRMTATAREWLASINSKSAWTAGVVIAFLLLLVSPKTWLLSAIDHEIELVSVQGHLQNVQISDVEHALQGVIGGSFLLADLEEIKANVQTLPWVDNVMVSRVWPGKVVLDLTEQTPVAYWNQQSFLNPRGEVFTPQEISSQWNLPKLVGPEASDLVVRIEMLQEMQNLSGLLMPHDLQAEKLLVDERGSWQLVLRDGLKVALGNKPFESKIERLASLLTSKSDVARAQMERVDTRYPNGVAVKWKDVTLADGASR